MTNFELIGYVAAFLTFSTFYMKTMTTLRVLGIFSNISFIIYGSAIGAYPIVILHSILMPLNAFRLYQVIKLGWDVKKFSTSEFSFAWLQPYSEKRNFSAGEVIFYKGDLADKIYFLSKGKVRINDLDKIVEEGEILGEIGIFSVNKQRTYTVTCITDISIYEITEEKLFRLYYQNPSLGFYLTKIVVNRLLENRHE